jgi:hypothetical protein
MRVLLLRYMGLGANISLRGAIQYGTSGTFSGGIRQHLLNHDHPAILDHSEDQQHKHWRNNREFHGSCSSLFSE